VGKFFGGQWLSRCGGLDGNKYVCLDDLYNDVQNGKCLIYSFGIFADWTFEEAMANLGCTIRAFDPTTKESTKPKNDLVMNMLSDVLIVSIKYFTNYSFLKTYL